MTAAAPAPRAQDNAATAAPATAAAVDPEARRLADRGLAHFEAGRYREAIDDFEASYKITPAPGLLYNLAQAQRLGGDCGAALALYRRFLAAHPAGNIRTLTEARIAETERCAGQDGGAPQAASAPIAEPKSLATPPPSASLSLTKKIEPTRPALGWRRRAGIGAGAAAIALGIVGARYGWQAQQASDDVSAIYAREGTWGPYAMARERSGQADERTALWLGAGALVAAGLSLWLLVRK
jgi:tetratricopeptide (TPR) repeat protein